MPDVIDPVRMRKVLLDALQALHDHREAVVIVGAQAVYFWTGKAEVALAESTKDIDVAIDSRHPGADPLLEDAMQRAGFHRNPTNRNPGAWTTADGIDVDLMVPEELAGSGRRRGIKVPPHDGRAARRAVGLEAAVVDNTWERITALDTEDHRIQQARVASPGALLVAKLHKLQERMAQQPGRSRDKDAHDMYRLLVAIPTDQLAESWH